LISGGKGGIRKLLWDPKNWSFIDDKEANTWLDRARRDPWQLPRV